MKGGTCMKRIQKIETTLPRLNQKKKVAAYARVSVSTDRTLHSLSQQVSYYNDFISKNKNWEFAGVFSDEGLSGRNTNRLGFNEMLEACENGKIDLIITKSISRFGRNTVDLLETVRHLKSIGVEVIFEKENIKTLSGDGELMLSILASFAQEEAMSISNNVKWRVRKNFKEGKVNNFVLYGYRWDGEKFNLVPEEAEVIKYCYKNFLEGKSAEITAEELRRQNIKGLTGIPFSPISVRAILKQEKYTGNSLLQKTYTDFFTKKEMQNSGELPMYWAENTHPKIIELETFRKVQNEMERRRKLGARANISLNTTCFTSKIHCSCGKNYQRRQSNKKNKKPGKSIVWMCASQKNGNRQGCINPSIQDYILKKLCCKILGIEHFSEEIFYEKISDINVLKPGLLEFVFKDGHKEKLEWKSTARKDWWTEQARLEHSKLRQNPEFSRKIDKFNNFTSFIKCEKCGKSYIRQKIKHANGEKTICYYCSTPSSQCENSSIQLHVLEELISKELRLEKFDSNVMIEKLSKLSIKDNTLYFYYKDGTVTNTCYENPIRQKHNHSEETKRKISEANIERWRLKREEKSNNDTSD